MAEDARARPSLPPVLEARAGLPHQNGSRTSARAGPFGAGQKCQRTKSPEHPSTREDGELWVNSQLLYPTVGQSWSTAFVRAPQCAWAGVATLAWLSPSHALPPSPSLHPLESPPHKLPHSHPGSGLLWENPDVDTGSALFLWPSLRNRTSLRCQRLLCLHSVTSEHQHSAKPALDSVL